MQQMVKGNRNFNKLRAKSIDNGSTFATTNMDAYPSKMPNIPSQRSDSDSRIGLALNRK